MEGARALGVRTSIGLYWVSVYRFLVLGTVRLQFKATEAPIERAAEGSHIDLGNLDWQFWNLHVILNVLSSLIRIYTIYHRPQDMRQMGSAWGLSSISKETIKGCLVTYDEVRELAF